MLWMILAVWVVVGFVVALALCSVSWGAQEP